MSVKRVHQWIVARMITKVEGAIGWWCREDLGLCKSRDDINCFNTCNDRHPYERPSGHCEFFPKSAYAFGLAITEDHQEENKMLGEIER